MRFGRSATPGALDATVFEEEPTSTARTAHLGHESRPVTAKGVADQLMQLFEWDRRVRRGPLGGPLRDEDHGGHRLVIVVSWGGAGRRQKGRVRVLWLALGARRRCADVGRNALGQHRDPVTAAVVVAVTRELQPPEGSVDAHQPCASLSATAKQFLHRQTDVTRDLAEEDRRNITTAMERYRRAASIGMPVLAMRPTLTDFDEPQSFQQRHHLARLEDWDGARHYDTWIVWIPTNSDSSLGSPSSRSIPRTS